MVSDQRDRGRSFGRCRYSAASVRGALFVDARRRHRTWLENERLGIVKVFLIAAGVMVVLSFLLAGTIAGPVRRLADSAQLVRQRIRSRVEIPDFTQSPRRDRPSVGNAARHD